MSHLSSHMTKLADIDSIKDACDELGLTFTEGGKIRYYGSNSQKADYVISWAGSPYDVGLVKEVDGTFKLIYDEYQGHVEKKLGKGCGKLVKAANYHRIFKKAKAKNWMISKKITDKGTIQMTLSRY